MSSGSEARLARNRAEPRALLKPWRVSIAGPLLVLLLWWLVTRLGLAPPLLLPSPSEAFGHLWRLMASGSIVPDIGASMYRWSIGYVLGCALGMPVGLLIGTTRWLYFSSFPLLDFFRSLPVTALFPLFLLIFGIGDNSKIAMVFAATFPVVVLASAYGVLHATKTRIRAAKVFGASRWQVFKWVTFYEALPGTLVGMRTALSLALIVVIVSEMFIGTQLGLGQRVYDSYTVNNTRELYAVLLLTGILGYLMNRIFLAAERTIVFWAGK